MWSSSSSACLVLHAFAAVAGALSVTDRASTPAPVPARRGLGPEHPLFAALQKNGRRSSSDGEGSSSSRLLRFGLKEEEVNTTVPRRRRLKRAPQDEVDDDEWFAEAPDWTTRDKWNWKDIEDFRGLAYFIELEIGDPIQTVLLMPDTGSWETWVNPNCQYGKTSNRGMCLRNGQYDPSQSQLARYLDEDGWYFGYGTGSAEGVYVEDRVYYRHEDIVVRQKFGLATDSIYAVSGLMGLGYGYGFTIDYYNIVDTLVVYNYINAPIFSVSLGRIAEGFSEIIFGGINRSRFSGYLTPVPIWPSVYEQPAGWTHVLVNVTSFSITHPDGHTSPYFRASQPAQQVSALVDTGVTWSFLPHAVVDRVIADLGAWQEMGEWRVDCSYRDGSGTANFGFNGDDLIVKVPLYDFIFQLQDGSCVLGVQKREGQPDDAILGLTFLRGAYTVYDQMTHTLWLADYKRCGIASQVEEVGRYMYDVGDIKGLC